MSRNQILALTLLASQLLHSSAYAQDATYLSNPTLVSVDLRDLAQFSPHSFPEAQIVLESTQKNPELYKLSAADKLMGIELSESPLTQSSGTQLHLIAFVKSAKQGYLFRKLSVEVASRPGSVSGVSVLEDIPLAKTHFTIRSGIVQRKVILEDKEHGIRKIYPLEVGGIDPGIKFTRHTGGNATLVTPLFAGAHIDRALADPAKHSAAPDYYHGLPFMPITRADGMIVSIAFHIIQHPEMQRSFDSHGCMRLRAKDLLELYAILAHGGSSRIPVDVSLTLPEDEDHPYPQDDQGYMVIRNCDKTGKNPRFCRDPNHHLTEMDHQDGRPPFEELLGQSALDGDKMDQADFATLIDPTTGLPIQDSGDRNI
jgi:hypothetical protein